MVHEIKDRKLSERLRDFVKSPFFIPAVLLLFIVITLPIVYLVSQKPVDIRQRAAEAGLTATINATPASGSVAPNQSFTVDVVVDGGGQAFNAAQASVSVTNLTVQSLTITPPDEGGCNITFATSGSTPSVSNPSFAGAILNSSSTRCTLYTMTLVGSTAGSGSVSISNGQVKAYSDNTEIFLSSQNGIYNITPTPSNPIPQSTVYLDPQSAAVNSGQSFVADVRINTNGQMVNAIETDINYPANLLTVTSVSPTNGDFGTQAINNTSNGKISIAYGSIVPKSGDLLVVKVTFQPIAAGVANVDFKNTVVVSSVSNTDVLKNTVGGVYTINSTEVTVVPTSAPTVTTAPTATSVPPTPTSVPQPTATSVPSTPTPTSAQPTATIPINPQLSVSVSNSLTGTYKSTQTLMGTKSSNATLVFVNNSSSGVTYPSATTWQSTIQLNPGQNNFLVFSQDGSGNRSNTVSTSIRLHKIGDINGDDLIDLTDLSMFGADWEKTDNFNHVLSDMNDDGVINLTDFSIFAKAYGN